MSLTVEKKQPPPPAANRFAVALEQKRQKLEDADEYIG
jgi:hypothetical protein